MESLQSKPLPTPFPSPARTNLRIISSFKYQSIRNKDIEPIMITGVKVDVPAMDHIIGRVQAGWTYTRADSLAEI